MSLLAAMWSHTASWSSYFFDCDYHWNEYGNAVGQELLPEALGPGFYERAPPVGRYRPRDPTAPEVARPPR